MTIRGTILFGRLASLCALLFVLAGCGGGGGGFLADNTELAITTTGLPEASAGSGYTAVVEATGGNPPYAWSITNSNSTGLEIDNQGFITGTAPAEGNYPLVIEVEDRSNNKRLLSVILSVIIGPDSLAIATTALPNAIDGIRYTAVIDGAGGEKPYIWSVTDGGGTGFGINNEGILSGIAPRSGDYGLSLRLTDNADTQATASFVLTVTGDTPQPLAISTTSPLPSVEEGKAYTAILEAVGGNGDYLWLLENGGGSGLQLRDDGALTGTAPVEGQYGITVSVTDDTRTVSKILILEVTADSSPLTITAQSLPEGTVDDRYAAVLTASGGDKPYAWTLVSNGGQSGLVLSSAGVLSGTPTLAGTFGLIIQVSDGISTDQSAITLTIAPAGGGSEVLDITTGSLPDADRTLYAALVEATGGEQPYVWSGNDISVPGTGFQMNPASGLITGNTNELLPGQYGYTVTVSGAAGATDTQSYVITVPGGDSPPVRILTENPLPLASETLYYSTILRAVGGGGARNYLWSVEDTAGFPGTPPSFANAADIASGVLTWPTADVVKGNYLITIQVDDPNDSSSDIRTYDLQASGPPVRITTDNPLPGGIVGTEYSFQFSTSGGGNSNTWSSAVTRNGSNYSEGPSFTGIGITNGTLTWPPERVEQGNYVITVKVVSQDVDGFASENTKLFDLGILPKP
mgnify:CR=1 FL=1